jgi:SAM-dependent methyltransferase
MKITLPSFTSLLLIALLQPAVLLAGETSDSVFEPISGQAGKDVVWVPTPPTLVEKMLDLARVTPADYVMDLGSGDGRNIIAAAKRGARALGVEFNPDMVELSAQLATKAGVADRARFMQGDMFEADISQATVLALFLLPENLDRLVDKFLGLKPGSRIVLNTFGIKGWTADRVERASDCGQWCEALLYIVPARVGGQWQLDDGILTLEQQFQQFTGSLRARGIVHAVSDGRLEGNLIRFSANGRRYFGRVDGERMEGDARGADTPKWSARRSG